MEAAGELKWDIEPCNGRSYFFTRESYEKYCLGPTLAELLLISSKPDTAETTQKDSEATCSQTPAPDIKPPVAPSAAKDILPFPEPRLPYPRFSSLSAFEQDAYVKLMIRFLNKKNTNISFRQAKEYNQYQFLKSKLSNEVPEFQKFLQNAARICADDYNVLCADAELYVQEMIKACQTYVKNYPPFYSVHEITSILGGKFIPDLTLNLEKCLLKMGSVKFVKITFPSDDIPLSTSYKVVSQMMPPIKKADRVHVDVTSDANIYKLVPKYCPQVVLTSRALFTLLNNHAPGYNEQWEIPVCVKTIDGIDGKQYKVAYMDAPLPKKELSRRERSLMFHEVVLDKLMVKNSMVPLKTTYLDRDSADFHVEAPCTSRNLPHVDTEMGFTSDVTELETFGSVDKDSNNADIDFTADVTDVDTFGSVNKDINNRKIEYTADVTEMDSFESEHKDANTNTPLSDSESPKSLSCSLKYSLQDILKMEKQVINHSNQAKFGVSSDPVHSVKKKKVSNEEESDMSVDSENKLRISSASSTGIQTTSSNDTDSDEDKLVIDIDCKKSACGDAVVTPSVKTAPKPPRKRKSARKISKDVDPLGQILKMQTQLLKTDTKKMERTSSLIPEKSEQSAQHTPSFQQTVSGSSLESQKKVEVSRSSNKHILSSDLKALQEDAAEYTVEPEENCSYKLYSLDDMLLLIKSSVHTAKTRSLKKPFKVKVPVFVLTKVDYQACYGVESLTESDVCRLWTESLIHSNCDLYVGHVNALTSKLFMLEEISAEHLKESMNILKPANCLNSLRHILKWVTGHEDGSYLLSHVSGDSSVYLYKSTKYHVRGAYNLHDAHCNAPKESSSLSVPWVALNPNLLLKYHIQHGRPPCSFPPAPEQDTGFIKQEPNQPRIAPCKEMTKVLPAAHASNVTKAKKKGRNKRTKAKQKARKAAAKGLQGNT